MTSHKQPLSMRGIRTFSAAARHQSFKRAAEVLFITASAVSHQIRRLEQELGVELFERSGRNISLTEAGSMLFEEASKALGRVDDAVARLRGDCRRSSLRISVQPFFASELFVPHLNGFTGAYPHIDIQIDTSDETRERHPATADISIRLFRQPPTGMSSNLLFPLRVVPACSPAFRKKLDIVGWHVASAVPIIVHSGQPNVWKSWSDHSGIKVPETSHIVRFDTMLAVARAAEQGLGAALVPLPLAEAWFASGRLVRLFDYELVTDYGYYLVVAKDEQERDEIRALRSWVLEEFAQAA